MRECPAKKSKRHIFRDCAGSVQTSRRDKTYTLGTDESVAQTLVRGSIQILYLKSNSMKSNPQ